MSIIIKGMEMPTKDNLVCLITPDGDVWRIADMPCGTKHLAHAKAVELPPHGDLIQRSDVLAVVDEAYEYGVVIKRKDFDEPNIPTIVPAEKGVE